MALPSRHLATLTALALERAAFSRPGPDGRMQPHALADVQAILEQLQGRGLGRGAALGYAFDPDEPRDEDGQWTQSGAPEDDEDEPEDEDADLRQEWADYDAEREAWQAEYKEAAAAHAEAHAAWQQATAAHEAWEAAHDEWEARQMDREQKQADIDEADPVAAADAQADKVFAELSSPSWDSANQQEPAKQYLAEASAIVAARLGEWDKAFGKDSLARQVLCGTDEKILARWDKLAGKGREKLARQADKFKAAVEKYAALEDRYETEYAAYEGSDPDEPEAPDEPDLEEPIEPDEGDFDTDQEYKQAQADYKAAKPGYDQAWDDYEKAVADYNVAYDKWQDDTAAWEKRGKQFEKMEAAAAKLSGKVDDEESALATVWDDQRDYLTEAQDDIKATLVERIEAQAEADPEPDEPDEPEDEPELEEPDEPDEPGWPRPADRQPPPEQHARRTLPISYARKPQFALDVRRSPFHLPPDPLQAGITAVAQAAAQGPPPHPLQAGLMALAEGAFALLTRPPPAPPVVHVAPAAAPVVHVAPAAVEVNVPPPVESPLAYQRDADLQAVLAGLAEAVSRLAQAQGREHPAPVIHVAPAAVEVKVEVPPPRRRKVRVLRDEDGTILGSVEE